jgi:hypothetical protein
MMIYVLKDQNYIYPSNQDQTKEPFCFQIHGMSWGHWCELFCGLSVALLRPEISAGQPGRSLIWMARAGWLVGWPCASSPLFIVIYIWFNVIFVFMFIYIIIYNIMLYIPMAYGSKHFLGVEVDRLTCLHCSVLQMLCQGPGFSTSGITL